MPPVVRGFERERLGNAFSWFDWELVSKHADVHRFFRVLAQWRLYRDVERDDEQKTLNQLLQEAMKAWHGTKLFQPDWSGWSHSVACPAELPTDEFIRVILNAFWQPLEFELPECIRPCRRWIDTSVDTPNDIVMW